ncbi:hypothetical protein [Plantactinospora sonchi]|uniref:Uncharacterized protein n=1 Tax=Plantactinospora sonchi TaxID=1544735 RepID=A0ABU7RN10_9ACTN
MNSGVITLMVSGPVPGSERGDAEAATTLIRELHARTILHVARPETDDRGSTPPGAGTGSDVGTAAGTGGRGGTPSGGPVRGKGTGLGTLAELVVTGLFSATTVAALAQVIIAFVQRGAARQITLRDGRRTLTISEPTEETERMVAEWLGVPPTQTGAGSGAD